MKLGGIAKNFSGLSGLGVYEKVVSGMSNLYKLREKRRKAFPKIGIGITVTTHNYMHLTEFFFKCIDLNKLDHISLELQAYTTKDLHKKYEMVLQKEFGIKEAVVSSGLICEHGDFEKIDVNLLSRQIDELREECKKRNILFNCYPHDTSIENLKHYFNAEWLQMKGSKRFCPFPWISAEINARGEVASCHSMYDLTYGNVYNENLIDIWNNSKYEKFRQYMRKQLLPICPACCQYYNERIGGE